MPEEPSPTDPNAEIPTQRLPGRGPATSKLALPGWPRQGEPLSSEEAAGLAAHMLEPTLAGGAPTSKLASPGSTPPTLQDSAPAAPARPREAPTPRPVLGDRYELLNELGRGGMGVVYRAHDKTLGRDVALKVLQLGGRVDDEALERFQREARAAAALDHPNIVRVHDVGKLPSGSPYYTMELLSGHDLAHAIMEGQISPKDSVEAIRQVSLALFYAHQKGILHRDLKPQNIFLRQQAGLASRDPAIDPTADSPTVQARTPAAGPQAGTPEVHALLLDFGLAKLAEGDLAAHAEGSQGRKSMQSLTRSGEIFGTPAYMPPEQTRGAKDVDARADIYSLGAALYHALAGRTPFDAASLGELLYKVQRVDPSPPSDFNAEVDADLDTIALKCLQKDPKDRYQTAGELAEDLKLWLAGDPISARPIGFVGRVWRKAKRNKVVAGLVALLIVGSLATAGWFGGGAAVRAWNLAGFGRAYDAAMKAHDFDAAARAADNGHDLAPNDGRWRERKDTALYEKAATVGRTELTRWRIHRDKAADLAAKAQTAPQGPAPGVTEQEAPSAEERKTRRKARWGADEAFRGEELEREDAWSKASVAFTEALTHRVAKEAEDALTELYWDRYVRAEKDRDTAAMGVYESYLVQFGKEKYERELRGRRDVRVRFWLPPAYQQAGPASAGQEVVAYLSEYRRCKNPPVLVPVPYDVARGRPAQDQVENLTVDDARWLPVPLAATEGAAGGAPTLPADELAQLVKRADAAIASKHYADALPVLDRLTRAVPSSSAHPYNLACCLARAGAKNPDALVALEEAVRRGWNDAQATEKDEDLASLRDDLAFASLLAVMRGDLPRRHVRIDSVVAGSAAEKAGVRAGDVLVTIDGKKVETVDEAKAAIQAVAKEKPCEVVVRRAAAEERLPAQGVPPLGVQLSQVDLTPGSPTRFPWKGEVSASDPVAQARTGSLFEPRQQDENRLHLPVAQEAGRPYVEFKAHLLRGSYLLYVLPGQGLLPTRYPFEVAREYPWDEACELPADSDTPPLPPALSPIPYPLRTGRTYPPGPTARAATRMRSRTPSGTPP